MGWRIQTLKAKLIHHRKQDSIHAYLTIVMTVMACGHVLEQVSGLSLRRLVHTLNKYRSFTLAINRQIAHVYTPVPDAATGIIKRLPKPD